MSTRTAQLTHCQHFGLNLNQYYEPIEIVLLDPYNVNQQTKYNYMNIKKTQVYTQKERKRWFEQYKNLYWPQKLSKNNMELSQLHVRQ